jgi:cytoskeletal protein RodZ
MPSKMHLLIWSNLQIIGFLILIVFKFSPSQAQNTTSSTTTTATTTTIISQPTSAGTTAVSVTNGTII